MATRPEPPGHVTDPSRVIGEEISLAAPDGARIDAHLARPTSSGPYPGVVLIHAATGLNAHHRDVAARLANVGYATLVPDMFARERPPAGDMQAVFEVLFAKPDAQALGDLEAAADFLRAREDVTDRIGCIGFCMGGRYTLLFACSSDRLSAAVDCWGGFIDRASPDAEITPERPTPVLDLVPNLHCPLMAAIGLEDENPSPQVGERLREALEQTGQPTQVDFYEGAGHAFFADDRPTYRPQAAALLWERVVPFFAEHLQG